MSEIIDDVKSRFADLEGEVKEKIDKTKKDAAKTVENKAKGAQ